ncbi:MAG: hypothetical protein M3N57_10485 [Actinomycetota bacterium]|nr:hypothetical protein [Actinomycetota bacterium]
MADADRLRRDGAQVESQVVGEHFSRAVAFNVLAHCGEFQDDRYTVEEHKLIAESRKILGLPDLAVSPTNVRVPVVVGHCLAAKLTFQQPVSRDAALATLDAAPGLVVVDGTGRDGQQLAYPTPLSAAGRDEVLVGRVRQDLWCMALRIRPLAGDRATNSRLSGVAGLTASSIQGLLRNEEVVGSNPITSTPRTASYGAFSHSLTARTGPRYPDEVVFELDVEIGEDESEIEIELQW